MGVNRRPQDVKSRPRHYSGIAPDAGRHLLQESDSENRNAGNVPVRLAVPGTEKRKP
jgi:hypothetical protein